MACDQTLRDRETRNMIAGVRCSFSADAHLAADWTANCHSILRRVAFRTTHVCSSSSYKPVFWEAGRAIDSAAWCDARRATLVCNYLSHSCISIQNLRDMTIYFSVYGTEERAENSARQLSHRYPFSLVMSRTRVLLISGDTRPYFKDVGSHRASIGK